jgi:HD-like signal output (HDOD) protein
MFNQINATPPVAAQCPIAGQPLDQSETRKLLSSIQIPPQPEIVMALMHEKSSDDPDIQKISRLISNDAGIAAAVLKTVNSPFYGLNRKITSVQQAVSALGMKNIGSLVMGLALRNSVPVKGMDHYWESTNRTAEYAVMLARQLGCAMSMKSSFMSCFMTAPCRCCCSAFRIILRP